MSRAIIGTLFFLGGLLWSAPILAAPTASIISTPDNIVIGQSFTLTASASGMSSGSNYFTKIRIGSTSAAMNKGQTFNSLNDSPDDWLSDTSEWSKFPIVVSDSNGAWTGSLTARLVDSAFLGSNYFVFRLRSATGTNYDSASVSALISPAPPAPIQSPAITTSPAVSITVPEKITLGEPFKAKIELVGFDADSEYFYKLRAGLSETVLTKAQTQNGVAFLSDTETWTKFPVVRTDPSGKWSGEVTGRFEEDRETGTYKIRARLRKKDTETSYDSSLRETTIIQAVIINTPFVATPTSSKPVITTEIKNSTETKLVLGTKSAETQASNYPEPQQDSKSNPAPLVMIGLGAAVIAVSAAIFVLNGRLGV